MLRLALAFPVLFAAMPAYAHLELESPASRYGPFEQKQGPCGRTDGVRSENVTTFQAGETIEVRWNEFINHPGHFRIAFDADGDNDFVEPACLSGCDTRSPVVEYDESSTILLDRIADKDGGDYVVEVTLPDIACENCTLQVMQVMFDKPPYTLPGNDLYYQCADLVLVKAPGTTPPGVDPSEPPEEAEAPQSEPEDDAPADGGGCSTLPPSTAALLPTVLLWAFVWRRRSEVRTTDHQDLQR